MNCLRATPRGGHNCRRNPRVFRASGAKGAIPGALRFFNCSAPFAKTAGLLSRAGLPRARK
eukprot:12273842-Alexandrium_andersonii.AAC.1